VNLKYALGEVETYRGSHHGGRFLFCGRINNDHTMAHSTPDTGAVHPIRLKPQSAPPVEFYAQQASLSVLLADNLSLNFFAFSRAPGL